MQINASRRDGTLYVAINGTVEQNQERELARQMRSLLKDNFNEVVFDLSQVPFMTAPTIGKFLMFYRNASATGRSMRIKGVHDGIYRYFSTLRLNRLFPVEK